MRVKAARNHLYTVLSALLIFAINVWIASSLFRAEFTGQTGSIEGSFIAFAGYIARNWNDLGWFPLWFGGMPLHNVYQPGMHYTVALLITCFHLTPQHAYHVVAALAFCLGPVTLFLLCEGISGDRGFALGASVLYSSINLDALLSATIFSEAGGPLHSRRFENLLWYGEGPHIMALVMLPLAILWIYRAAHQRKRWYFPLAAFALAGLVLTNWPGTIGLTMAVLAFLIAECGTGRFAWLRFIAIAVVAYLIASPVIPPSTVLLVPRNAQQSDATHLGVHQVWWFGVFLVVMAAVEFLLRRVRSPLVLRFGVLFTLMAGGITLARFWFDVNLLPQGHRFQLEMEMGMAIVIAYLGKLALDRVPARVRQLTIAALGIALVPILWSNRTFAGELTRPIDMAGTSQYRIAQAFARLRPHDRVFAGGNPSFWLNIWTDTPQVSGCCDQGVPDWEHRIADYTIYSGKNAGDRDAAVSIDWLRAYGATSVAVMGLHLSEPQTPFHNPRKFEGVLPVLWREGDDVIYDLPALRRSLAYVIPRAAVITEAPANGLITGQLERYIRAIDNPALPAARFEWQSHHSAHVSTEMKSGQMLSVQISLAPGWQARVNGKIRGIERDKIGQMMMDTGCEGRCEVDLEYDGGTEARWMSILRILGLIAAVTAPLLLPRGEDGGTPPARANREAAPSSQR